MKSTSDPSNKKKLVRILIVVIFFLVLVTVGIIVYANLKPNSNEENSTETTSEELASNTDIASNTDTSTELSTEVTTEEITEEVTTESTTEESSGTTENNSNDYVPPTTQAETTEAPSTEDTEETPVHTCSFTVVENVAPTCTTDGYVKEACSCGKTRTTTTDAHGHSWVTTTETIHHDEVVEQVRMVVFTDGYEMVYTTGEAIDAYIKKCALEKGYMPSYTICDRFVVVQEAYDEVITTTTCSHCGCPQ